MLHNKLFFNFRVLKIQNKYFLVFLNFFEKIKKIQNPQEKLPSVHEKTSQK